MTEVLNVVKPENKNDMEGKYLTFWVNEQLYGLPIADVVQIIGLVKISPVPEFPTYAKGIINLRGSMIPIIDMRLRFGMKEIEYTSRTCIVVTNVRDRELGILVEGINEVANIGDDEIDTMANIFGVAADGKYLSGIGKHESQTILLVDTKRILNDEQLDQLNG